MTKVAAFALISLQFCAKDKHSTTCINITTYVKNEVSYKWSMEI